MKKIILLVSAILFSISGLNSAEIRVWPGNPIAVWPSGHEQFMFVELPPLQLTGAWRLEIIMPKGTEIKGIVTGKEPAVPGRKETLKPAKFRQEKRNAIFDFSAGTRWSTPANFLPLAISVQTPPGKAMMTMKISAGGKEISQQELPVLIAPPLKGRQPRSVLVGAYDYPGLDPAFFATYGSMLRGAGINALYHMRGEYDDRRQTFSDLAQQYGIRNGLVFGFDRIEEFYKSHELPGKGKVNADSLAALLEEQPELLKEMMKYFFDSRFGGKRYSAVVYDAEAGGMRSGAVCGSFAPGALLAFRRFAKIPDGEQLDKELIQKKYAKTWVNFYCDVNFRYAKLIREVMDQYFPGMRYEVYSGYEYDFGPMKNRTRENYGTDWSLMRNSGIDYAAAGYGGAIREIAHTAAVTGVQAPYLPAEMYIENFPSKQRGGRMPEPWSMRLIESYLNGSGHGLMLWYANVFDGAALSAIDRFTSFVSLVEDFILRGEQERQMIGITPDSERDRLYVYKQSGNLLIIVLNSGSKQKTVRLNMSALRLKGYAGESCLNDLNSGEKLKATPVLPLILPPYSARVLLFSDDGN